MFSLPLFFFQKKEFFQILEYSELELDEDESDHTKLMSKRTKNSELGWWLHKHAKPPFTEIEALLYVYFAFYLPIH